MMTGPIIILRIFPFVLKPISQEFGWGRTTFSIVLMVASLTSALLYPAFGRLVDRFGARAVAVPGMLLLVVTTMSLSLMTQSKLQLMLQFVVLGFSGAAAAALPFVKVIASWFGKRRGLALALLVGGAQSASGFFLSWLAQWTVTDFGWRTSWVIFGAIPLLSIPVLCVWLKERPSAMAKGRPGERKVSTEPGVSVKEALRSPNFWLLLVALMLNSLVSQGMTQHLVAMLTDRGVNSVVAASAVAVGPIALLLGHLSMGYTIDRVSKPRHVVPFLLLSVGGLIVLSRAENSLLLNAGAFIFNLGVGAEYGFGAYLITRYFGLRNFTAIYGALTLTSALSTGLGPTVFGASFDFFGSYNLIMSVSLGALCVSGLLIALLGPYRYAADPAEPHPSQEEPEPEDSSAAVAARGSAN